MSEEKAAYNEEKRRPSDEELIKRLVAQAAKEGVDPAWMIAVLEQVMAYEDQVPRSRPGEPWRHESAQAWQCETTQKRRRPIELRVRFG